MVIIYLRYLFTWFNNTFEERKFTTFSLDGMTIDRNLSFLDLKFKVFFFFFFFFCSNIWLKDPSLIHASKLQGLCLFVYSFHFIWSLHCCLDFVLFFVWFLVLIFHWIFFLSKCQKMIQEIKFFFKKILQHNLILYVISINKLLLIIPKINVTTNK